MVDERRQLVDEIVAEALELSGSARVGFLTKVCGADGELRSEVDSLLSHATAPGPLASTFTIRGLRPSEKIDNRWEIIEHIATGGMGEVYEAEDLLQTSRRVALKAIRPEVATDPRMIMRFKQEVRIGQEVTHANVCRVFELGYHEYQDEPQELFYMTMELLRPGATLAKKLKDQRFPVDEVVGIIQQILAGLSALHKKDYVHRDLKPSNIMLVDERGSTVPRVVITDLGLARHLVAGHTAEAPFHERSGRSGTPEYMAPEQVSGGDLSEATDLYAVGVIFYEMLTGVLPFRGRGRIEAANKRLTEDPRPPRELVPDLEPALNDAVMRCLDREPRHRFRSADEMSAALTGTVQIEPVRANRFRRVFSKSALYTAVALLLVCAAAVLFFLISAARPSAEAARWYDDGIRAMRDGSYVNAMLALERCVQLDPRYALGHARLAEAAALIGYADKAKTEMLKANGPRSSWLRNPADRRRIDAIQAFVMKDYKGAIEGYKRLLNLTSSEERPAVLVDLGRAYEFAGDFPNAIKSYTGSIALNRQYAAPFLRLAGVYRKQNQLDKANAELADAEALYRETGNAEGLTEFLYEKAAVLDKSGHSQAARPVAEEALQLARTTNHEFHQVRCLLLLSKLQYMDGQAAEGEKSAEQGVDIARRKGMDALAASGLVDVGGAALIRGEYAKAQSYLLMAIDLAKRYESGPVEARAWVALSGVCLKQGRIEEGAKASQNAVDFYTRNNFPAEAALARIPLGRALRDRGEYSRALAVFRESLSSAASVKSPPATALAEDGVASVFAAQENYPEALEHYKRSIAASEAMHDTSGATYSAISYAQTLGNLGLYTEALGVLEKVRPSIERLNLVPTLEQTLARISFSQLNWNETIRHARKGLDATKEDAEKMIELQTVVLVSRLSSGAAASRSACKEVTASATGDLRFQRRLDLLRAECGLAARDFANAAAISSRLADEFEQLGQPDSAFRSLAIGAAANARLGATQQARALTKRALANFDELKQRFGSYQDSYRKRPDIAHFLREVQSIQR